MRSRRTDSSTLQLAEWLAAKVSSAHSNDVGPLLGHAAGLCQSPWIDEPRPLEWDEAVAAALADPPGKAGTSAPPEVRSGGLRTESLVPPVLTARDPGVPRHKSH